MASSRALELSYKTGLQAPALQPRSNRSLHQSWSRRHTKVTSRNPCRHCSFMPETLLHKEWCNSIFIRFARGKTALLFRATIKPARKTFHRRTQLIQRFNRTASHRSPTAIRARRRLPQNFRFPHSQPCARDGILFFIFTCSTLPVSLFLLTLSSKDCTRTTRKYEKCPSFQRPPPS